MSALSLLVFAARFSDLPGSAATKLATSFSRRLGRGGQTTTRKLEAAPTPEDHVVPPFAFLDRSGRRGRLGGSGRGVGRSPNPCADPVLAAQLNSAFLQEKSWRLNKTDESSVASSMPCAVSADDFIDEDEEKRNDTKEEPDSHSQHHGEDGQQGGRHQNETVLDEDIAALFDKIVTRATIDAQVAEWDAEEKKKNDKTQELVDKLTKKELNEIVIGGGFQNTGYVGWIRPVKSIGWGGLTLQDGPQGYRTGGYWHAPTEMNGTAIAMPACGAVPLAWDADHAAAYGILMGKVFNFHGAHVILGPGVQLIKNPRNGRNFEYAGSEDPCLGARMAEGITRGQSTQGTLSCLKHYNYNDWEKDRDTRRVSNVEVPMAASMELYVRPFVAGLSAGAQSVMCAYNEFEGKQACGNKDLLDWLNNLNRRHFITTDWWVHTTPDAPDAKARLEAGLSMEMPGIPGGRNSLSAMIDVEKASNTLKRQAAFRILAAAEDGGQFSDNDFRKKEPPYMKMDARGLKLEASVYEEWRAVAKQLVVEQMVLLKNDNNILPLKPTDKLEVDVDECGENAMYLSGGGSGIVGYQAQVFPPEGVKKAEEKHLLKQGSGGFKLTCRSSYSSENMDREPAVQAFRYNRKGVKNRKEVDSKTIVWLSTPGMVPLGELVGAGAVLYSMYPGQLGGHALADILTGVYNPSGKLGTSLFGATKDWDPPIREYSGDASNLADGLGLGYRRHLPKKDKVLFWFGFGLPYFPPAMAAKGAKTWEDLVRVDVKLHNKDVRGIYFCVTSKVPADAKPPAEHQKAVLSPSPVVQFYAQKAGRDYPELISFRKVYELAPGDTACRIAFYDPVHVWKGDSRSGKFEDQTHWELLVSLNGPHEVKPVETISPKLVTQPSGRGTTKKYPKLLNVYTSLRERHAAELLLAQDSATRKRLEPVFLANKAEPAEVKAHWKKYLERANRSPIKTSGTKLSFAGYQQPPPR